MISSPSSIRYRALKPAKAVDLIEIYRNNIYQNLKEALENHFPLSRLLLGKEYFSHLAQLYIQNYPCTDPDLNFYGQELPSFAASQRGLKELDYLQDFMKLELLYQELYYAPENNAQEPKYTDKKAYFEKLLKEAPPEKTYLRLSSTARLLSSPHPLLGIWQYCLQAEKQGSDSVSQKLRLAAESQNIVIYRKDTEPYLEKVDDAVWPLLEAISVLPKGASLSQLSLGPFADHTPTEIIQKLNFLLERELLEL